VSRTSPASRRRRFFLLFLTVAAVCSIPRFGQRENEPLPRISDSDLYLDMAQVFTGAATGFNSDYVNLWPHHYNRPLLPFVAGHVAPLLPDDSLRAAFSLVDIFAITIAALLLMEGMLLYKPDSRIAWLPSLLLLSGFPQMNWGYHILTDTLGLTTAFIAAGYAAWLVRQSDAPTQWSHLRWIASLTLLFMLSSIAFLARETAWLAVITAGWLVFRRSARTLSVPLHSGLILLVLLLGKLPHMFYAHHYELTGVPFHSTRETLLDWRYLLDFAVKTAVSFNISWLLAAAAVFLRPRSRVPDFIVGWTIGGLAYMGAGYAANTFMLVGYPLRLSYVMFPLVFYLVTDYGERSLAPSRLISAALGFWLVQAAINWAGVMLDSGQGKMTVLDAATRLKLFFGL
jgi:hypothetical protein